MPASLPFDPFTDFSATQKELAAFAGWLKKDRRDNLARRLDFFTEQDPVKTIENLGFVVKIVKHGYTCLAFPIDDEILAYSVGYYYSFGFPELMLVAPAGTSPESLSVVVTSLGDGLKSETAPDDFRAGAGVLARHASPALKKAGLRADRLESPQDATLDTYSYGFGWYFYRHFMDSARVPLLLARLRKA